MKTRSSFSMEPNQTIYLKYVKKISILKLRVKISVQCMAKEYTLLPNPLSPITTAQKKKGMD